MNVDAFVSELSRVPVAADCFNQYAGASRASAQRRHNLARYLQQMQDVHPEVLLVGEAPGYRGCRLTGIPFTSERLLTEGQVGLLGQENGFRPCRSSGRPRGEATATLVWQAIGRFQHPPLLWNAYPFHPHRPSLPES
ncbi:MAG: hypothetical protein R3300_19020, partial [Candidatus Promineifilaceae bacterium]|nr:hypothetical protein [Candidatus Promineifilaceae bacterium]